MAAGERRGPVSVTKVEKNPSADLADSPDSPRPITSHPPGGISREALRGVDKTDCYRDGEAPGFHLPPSAHPLRGPTALQRRDSSSRFLRHQSPLFMRKRD